MALKNLLKKMKKFTWDVRSYLKSNKSRNETDDNEADDEGEGVTFYETENADVARHAKRAPAKGIDSFGEKDTFDFDEADDYQTSRDRNQNSDLSKRYYSPGLDMDEKHLH